VKLIINGLLNYQLYVLSVFLIFFNFLCYSVGCGIVRRYYLRHVRLGMANKWTISNESKALFCPDCSSMLNLPNSLNNVECPDCNYIAKRTYSSFARWALHNLSLIDELTSTPSLFMLLFRVVSDRNVADQVQSKVFEAPEDKQTQMINPTMRRATVAEPCPNCSYHELRFYTMQMRSVDEGQTVFYECEKCGHSYSTNT
jgi:DNA-directed RNA polymerase subunit M/transcription elongation factor TFIIS